jgi:uncharacterized protein YeaO (DUF488 family)
MPIQLKRAYEKPSPDDGFRVLVDRLWPRGLSKEKAQIDVWLKEIAPTTELRKWFAHDQSKWTEFNRRYRAELKQHKEQIQQLRNQAKKGPVTIVYGAQDERHNNAVVLLELLKQ